MSKPSLRPKKSLFSRAIPVIVVIAVLAGGVWWWKHHKGATDESAFRTARVQQGDIRVAISSTGTLSAISTVTVGSQISGQVTDVLVDFNSPVKKGDVLMRIDPSTYQAQFEQGSAQIASARAQLAQAQATLHNAELDYQRKSGLGQQKLVAQSDVDLSRTQLENARASVNSAQAQVNQQLASLKNVQVNIDRAVIRSPVDGVVLTRKIERGQTVAASFSAPELFTIAEDLSKMQIQLAVDESDIGQVQRGQTVTFTADAFPDRKFKGVVEQVRLAATTTSNVVTYPVVVTVDNSDGTLLPGLTVNAEIEVSKREGVMKISNAALRYKPVDNSIPASPLGGGGQQRPQGGQMRVAGGGVLDDLTRATASMNLNPQQQAAFDAAIAAMRERQQARMAQQGQNGGGPGGGGMMTISISGGNMADAMSKMRQMMAERMKQDFATFRETLDDEQKAQWDSELSGLVNAKRATVFRLANGKPEPVMVRLGASDGTDTEISGGGIKQGDELITGENAKAGQ
jgi:HlyD family secretion protein